MKLLAPLGISVQPGYDELVSLYGFERFEALPLNPKRVILHPLSKGSAVEWGIAHFRTLALQLGDAGFEVAITGTADEGRRIAEQGGIEGKNITNYCGRWNLNELISFIASSFALVAASTGPLHIAAASGIHSIGLYTPMRPMHPGRWAPVGKNAHVMVAPQHPAAGEKLAINPADVAKLLERLSAGS
jgi:ADP-heptose:LPS heptosyltransferase